MPMPRLSGVTNVVLPPALDQTAVSPIAIVPESGVSKPAMQRNSVVLPQPLGPSSVVTEPLGTVKLTPFSASTVPDVD